MSDNKIHRIVEIDYIYVDKEELIYKNLWSLIYSYELSLINTDYRKLNRQREHDPSKITIYRSPYSSLNTSIDSLCTWYVYTLYGIDNYKKKVKYTIFIEDHHTVQHIFTFKS